MKFFSNLRCFKILSSSKSLDTRNKLWSVAENRITLRFLLSILISDSFFKVICKFSILSIWIRLVSLFLLNSRSLKSEEKFINSKDFMNESFVELTIWMSLNNCLDVKNLMRFMRSKMNLINLFDFIEFITSNLVLDSTDIRDNELLFLIFHFIILINSVLISFMSSWIISLNLRELFSWTKVLSSKTSFLFAIQLSFLTIFKLDFSVSCSWYHSIAMTYHHISFLFSILYEVSLFFQKIRTYFLKSKSLNQYLHLCFVTRRLQMILSTH